MDLQQLKLQGIRERRTPTGIFEEQGSWIYTKVRYAYVYWLFTAYVSYKVYCTTLQHILPNAH